MTSPLQNGPPLVVLDTNVVLDLWLFADARVQPLRAALAGGQLAAAWTAPMRAELADVLQRPFVQPWGVPADAVMGALDACGCALPGPLVHAPWPPRCSDPYDQKFIDLAWALPAHWLFSRDRAVLKLARAARARGLRIATPEAWSAAQAAA